VKSSEVTPDLRTLDDPGLAVETEPTTKLLPPNFLSDFQSVEPLGHLLPPQVAPFFTQTTVIYRLALAS